MAMNRAIFKTEAWQKLVNTQNDGNLSEIDSAMVKDFGAWTLDMSRSGLVQNNLDLLQQAASQCHIQEQIKSAFAGEKINFTENRSVLHMSLRDQADDPLTPQKERDYALQQLDSALAFATKIRAGKVTDVVNIGIGGSDLGPKLLTESLRPYTSGPNIHYVSNVDPAHITETLKNLKPENTLFIIVSKTFTTQETLANAHIAKTWSRNLSTFCAVSTNHQAAIEFGVDENSIFSFADWVGGRYSLWCPVGLSSMIAIGAENFKQVLAGAHQADKDFLQNPIDKNLPIQLALWDIWNVNIQDCVSHAILPYEHNLESFARWFQQLAMESNGKSIDRDGKRVDYQTAPIYWGEVGTNGQHAFYQLLHQGTHQSVCEFVGFCQSNYSHKESHQILLANMMAQAKALYEGHQDPNLFKNFEGTRKSITLLSDKMTPFRLGELLAIYEHRVMAQGFLWNIPSFDQWGVELGKKLAKGILNNWDQPENLDQTTQALVSKIRKFS